MADSTSNFFGDTHMQKKLIALAVAGLASTAAFADSSNVTMYGIVDAALIHASGDGQNSQTMVTSGGLSTSRIGVKGVEDLGNGLKVVAVLEYSLDTQSNSSIGNARQEMLALAGSFGTVATGYLQTTGYDFGVKYDVVAGSTVSPLQDITNGNGFLIGAVAGANRANNAVAYISPNLSGFTFNYNHAWLANNLGTAVNTDSQITADLLSGYYDNGPVSVGLVFARTRLPALVDFLNQDEWALGASYDFGVAKISGTYQNMSFNMPGVLGNNNKVWSLGAAIPAGPGTVALSYAQSDIGMAALSDNKGYTAAYLYPLSKRSTVYGAYSHTSQDIGTNSVSVINSGLSNANLSLGGSSSLLALGLKHTF
jgi:predicted porin